MRVKEHPISFSSVQESCIEQLECYIKSRGYIDIKGNYNPSWVTRLFRDYQRTSLKVREAEDLIKSISNTTSLKDLNEILCKPLQKEGLLNRDRAGFMSRLGRCLLITKALEKYLMHETSNESLVSLSKT